MSAKTLKKCVAKSSMFILWSVQVIEIMTFNIFPIKELIPESDNYHLSWDNGSDALISYLYPMVVGKQNFQDLSRV